MAGFLAPFVATGITCALMLLAKDDFETSGLFVLYEFIIPIIPFFGLIMGIRSIPKIPELGDRDYAYSGIFLNVLFLVIFVLSLIYFSR